MHVPQTDMTPVEVATFRVQTSLGLQFDFFRTRGSFPCHVYLHNIVVQACDGLRFAATRITAGHGLGHLGAGLERRAPCIERPLSTWLPIPGSARTVPLHGAPLSADCRVMRTRPCSSWPPYFLCSGNAIWMSMGCGWTTVK